MNTDAMNTDTALVTALAATLDTDPADIVDLHARLAERAEQEAVLDLAYRVVDSPIGPLLVAASPAGLVRVAFEREGHDAVLDQLAGQISPRIMKMPARTDDVARQLDEYFAGHRRRFDIPIDLAGIGGFRRAVLERTSEIPFGTVITYRDMAERAQL